MGPFSPFSNRGHGGRQERRQISRKRVVLTDRATLIDRLTSAETSALLPPLPTRSLHPQSSPTKPRSISTTAQNAADQPKTSSTPAVPPPSTGSGQTANVNPKPNEPASDGGVISTGPVISSQRTEAIKAETIAPEAVTVAPGLPETRDVEGGSAVRGGFDIKMPIHSVEREDAQIIVSSSLHFILVSCPLSILLTPWKPIYKSKFTRRR